MGLSGPIDMRCEVVGSDPVGGVHGTGFRAYVAHRAVTVGEPFRLVGDEPGADPARFSCDTWGPTEHLHEQVGELLEDASKPGGVRMVRCVPHHHGGAAALADWAIGPLAAVLTDLEYPLALDLSGDDPVDLRAVFDLAVRHPALPIMLRLSGRWDVGLLLALLRAAPNLLLETSGLDREQLERALRFDAGRLVFGSGHPYGDPGTALNRLRDLASGAFDRIAGGTAATLLRLS